MFCKKKKKPIEEPARMGKSEIGAGHLWFPDAEIMPRMQTQGEFENGYPIGAVIHYTSGRWGLSGLDWGRNAGYSYIYIDQLGVVYQSNPLNKWGYHAGVSHWTGLGSSLSNKLIGIEVACAGRLTKTGDRYKAWFHSKNEYIEEKEVNSVPNISNIKAGYYHKFTEHQEYSLKHLLLWLYRNNSNVFDLNNVLGHDEIAPTRKSDPGGSLSISMPEYRKALINASLS